MFGISAIEKIRIVFQLWSIFAPEMRAAAAEGVCNAGDGTSASCKGEEPCVRHTTTDLFQWVRNNGGFIDKRLEIHSGANGRGIFTTKDISANQPIVSVPRDLILLEDGHPCDTIATLSHELSRGECSKYWPYFHSLLETEIDIPDAWELEDLALLDGLPSGDNHWKIHTERLAKDCEKLDRHDPFINRAVMIYVSRSGPEGIQPIFDLFNHGHNSTRHWYEEDGTMYVFRTQQRIPAGSEILNTFRMGAASGSEMLYLMAKEGEQPNSAMDYFRDYGFVERPPTFWHFPGRRGVQHSFIVEDVQNDGTFAPITWLPGKEVDFRSFIDDGKAFLANLSARVHQLGKVLPCVEARLSKRELSPRCGPLTRRQKLALHFRDSLISSLQEAIAQAEADLVAKP